MNKDEALLKARREGPATLPIDKVNELLDDFRDLALQPGEAGKFWLSLANLAGAYEEDNG